MVGLGQGAQIGNFAGHGTESGFNLEKQKMVGLGQCAEIGNFAGDGTEKQI